MKKRIATGDPYYTQALDEVLATADKYLSYAEVYDLKPEHIVMGLDGERWIRGQRKKSKEWFSVPLLPQALAIIDRYQDNILAQANGKVLPVYTNQKTNTYLKETQQFTSVP